MVSGDVVAVRPPRPMAPITASSGWLRHPSPSLPIEAPLHGTCHSQCTLNLLRWDACTVNRAVKIWKLSAPRACRLVSGMYSHSVGFAGVEVREDAGNRPVLPFVTRCRVVPDAIAEDRAADAAGEVPLLDERARRRETGVLQLVAVVAGHEAVRHAGEVDRARRLVAAAARHDAERGPPTSASPRPPDVVVTTSEAFEMSAT